MEMNSHQNVAASQLVAKTKPSAAARRGVALARRPWASSASDRICSHHSGWPPTGHAMDSAWARPAAAMTAARSQMAARPGKDKAIGMFSC